MAGQAASKTILFGLVCGSQQHIDRVIQIEAPSTRAPSDRALPPQQPASLTAQEDKQP